MLKGKQFRIVHFIIEKVESMELRQIDCYAAYRFRAGYLIS